MEKGEFDRDWSVKSGMIERKKKVDERDCQRRFDVRKVVKRKGKGESGDGNSVRRV